MTAFGPLLTRMFASLLPDRRFRLNGIAPPISTPGVLTMAIALSCSEARTLPVGSVPMKLPEIARPSEPGPAKMPAGIQP